MNNLKAADTFLFLLISLSFCEECLKIGAVETLK